MVNTSGLVLISSCLAGIPCRYDGRSVPFDLPCQCSLVPVCPETASGFAVPRTPMEISSRRVITSDGEDVTEQLTRGISKLLEEIDIPSLCCAVLKENSPSCGVNQIYDGSFTGTLTAGPGLFTRALISLSVPVFSNEELQLSPVNNDFLRCLGRTSL